jgi:hypothetical protein
MPRGLWALHSVDPPIALPFQRTRDNQIKSRFDIDSRQLVCSFVPVGKGPSGLRREMSGNEEQTRDCGQRPAIDRMARRTRCSVDSAQGVAPSGKRAVARCIPVPDQKRAHEAFDRHKEAQW